MFKYKVEFFESADVMEFESRYHIAMLPATVIPNVSINISLVYFEDADVTLNLAQVKSMEINGNKYLLRAYEV